MRILIFIFFILCSYIDASAQTIYPGKAPGKTIALHTANSFTLENNSIKIIFQIKNNQLHPVSFIDKSNNNSVNLVPVNWFELTMQNGNIISDKNFQLVAGPKIKSITPQKNTARYADKLNGKIIAATFINKSSGLKINWEARLTDDANYIQQQWEFHAKDSLPIIKYTMLEIPAASAFQDGRVDGSPIILKQMFLALEHPMSKNEINKTVAVSYLPVQNALQPSDSFVITTVMGATPFNQLRRGFLYYLERERAHPYRSYLHYNSWYDLSWSDRKMKEDSCLDRIKIYGDSLIKKRKVHVKAFLFDDGWDNDSTLWQVSKNFPEGFSRMQQLANSYDANLGLWISPWGGYDPSQSKRIKYGNMQHPPFETNEHGFSLAGPVYFNRFKKVTTTFMKKYNVSIFKFDGVGAGNGASGAGLNYQKDIEALLKLTKELRKVNTDLYLSLTVGTWPSAYWLFYGDATWRAGGDFGMMGTGTKRQKWITYRDGESYKNIVKRAPLYPLNSVMLHGINIAGLGYPAHLEMDIKDISDGIWDFFASGTSLQEMYINPHLLTTPMWNCLADAANWSQHNADVLQDVHWIGGDPSKAEIYGYAAWSPRKGIFSLRNPSSQTQTFIVDIEKIFELPENAASLYSLKNVIDTNDHLLKLTAQKGKTFSITLAPYELKIWEAIPGK